MTDEEYEEIRDGLAFAEFGMGDHTRLMASVDRLRALLAALVADEPRCHFDRDGQWACAYCDKVGYHDPACPWGLARAALK